MFVFGSEKRPSVDQQRHAPFGGIVAARWRHVQDAGIMGVFINDMLTDVSLEKVVAGFAKAWAVNTFKCYLRWCSCQYFFNQLVLVDIFSLFIAATPVRLVNGLSNNPFSGRVEILLYGQWATVCGRGWDLADAQVVCRQLGCGRVLSAPLGDTFGPGQGPIGLDDVNCNGHESELTQCGHRGLWTHDCGHQEDAGVVCEGNTFNMWLHIICFVFC
jgi:hypothetical protein